MQAVCQLPGSGFHVFTNCERRDLGGRRLTFVAERSTTPHLYRSNLYVLYEICCGAFLAAGVQFQRCPMDPISVLAASGIRSRMQSLDLLANNLANSATNGYKLDSEFYSLFSSSQASSDENGDIATQPSLDKHWTDFSQGLLETTHNPLDLALSGPGFFVANGPKGPLYTRDGSFQLSASGTLITAEGYPVRTQDGKTITVDPSAPVDIAADGAVQQQGQVLGQLDIASFADTSVLAKQGNNYFVNTNSSVTPTPAADTDVRQGQVEASNVKTPEVAVRLVGVMRQFEMLQKAITMSLDMNKKGIEEVARVP